MIKEKNVPLFYTSILYVTGLLLFLEWLYPLQILADFTNMEVFIVYTFFCFMISLLNMRSWLTFLIKGIGFVFVLYYLYSDDLSAASFYTEISLNIQMLLDQNWPGITGIFRSVLFLILIWLVSYLIHYWFVIMKRIFLFVMLTFIYIGLLDTFTVYDAGLSMIRIFIVSMIALAMASLFKEITNEQVKFTWFKQTYRWMIPMIGVVLLSSVIGYLTPSYKPKWPDPVPFIQSAADFTSDKEESEHTGKAGFGENDENLGGSFLADDSLVFEALVDSEQRAHYWRVLTKDTYTGKGWETAKKEKYLLQEENSIVLDTFDNNNVETEERTATLLFADKMTLNNFVYPYGIHKLESRENPDFYLDESSDKIQAKLENEHILVPAYEVSYQYPTFDISKLQQVTADTSVADQYTQTPKDLPQRVTDLAEEITANYTNRYDKARAIEQYFGRNGFVYDTDDVPAPAKDEDYVDQFLFESKLGYCDNYSTSMTVMLRTLDIPARWVKGFTAGTPVNQELIEDDDYNVYRVTNMNAHSWVEVYFPETGWVPFEPTQGFDNLADFVDSDVEHSDQENIEEEPEEPEDLETPEEDLLQDEEQQASESTENEKKMKSMTIWYVAGGLFIFFLLSFVVYKARFHIKTYFLLRKLTAKPNDQMYEAAYHHLLKALEHYVFAKDKEQTLREYAGQIDHHFGSIEMSLLTNDYEQILYNNSIKEINAIKWIELWHCLMKRVLKK